MSFDAHDLKVAFEDGVQAEQKRILALLKEKIITDTNNGDQHNEYVWYEKLITKPKASGKLYMKR